MFQLLNEEPDDMWEVEALLDTAFGPGRFALSAYRLRDGVEPVSELSLLARDEFGALCGSIRYWPVLIGDDAALLLGPIAVHPTRQGEGLGGKLMRESIQRAACLGWQNIVLVGDEPYYRRFGFLRNASIIFPPPTDPERILLLQLDEKSKKTIKGRVRKPPDFPDGPG